MKDASPTEGVVKLLNYNYCHNLLSCAEVVMVRISGQGQVNVCFFQLGTNFSSSEFFLGGLKFSKQTQNEPYKLEQNPFHVGGKGVFGRSCEWKSSVLRVCVTT